MPESAEKKLSGLTAAVIAGGKSSRFGEPKALIRFHSKDLVDYAIDLADRIARRKLLVYGEDDLFRHKRIKCIPDAVPNCGPLGGIYAALISSRSKWIASIPCDMPHLQPKVYELLFKRRTGDRPVVALSARGIESMVSIWPRSLANKIALALKERNYALHSVLQELGSIEVDFSELIAFDHNELFFNVNTKEDLLKSSKLGPWTLSYK